MNENLEAQEDELLALDSIFGPEVFVRVADRTRSAAAGEIRVSVELPQDFFVAVKDGEGFVYFGISSLPPLILSFEMPEEYPSSAPPTFTLHCSWLTNTQKYALDTHLADLYQATGGAVVLFSWVQFLKEDTLSFLNINSLLVLPSNVNGPPSPNQSESSSNNLTPPVPNPGSNRPKPPVPLTDNGNPVVSPASEAEAHPTPSLNVCSPIENLPDEEVPSDRDRRAAQIVKSHENVDDDDDDDDDDDTALLSSKTTHDCHASNQNTLKLMEGNSDWTAPGLLHISDPESFEQPCSTSSAPPPPTPPPPLAAAAAPASPQQATSSQTLLSLILVHDVAQKQRRFAESVLDCGVCLVSMLGSKCMQFEECSHVHCEPCLAQYCTGLISEGNVRGVTCPQPGCKATPTPAQVRKLVGNDLYHRYDRLLFQSSLDSMTDVVYCPRTFCASAVIVEPDGDMAQCSVCSFAFCVSCRQSFHGIGQCPAAVPRIRQTDAQDYVDIPLSLVGMMALWDDYCSGSAQRKKLLEKRYGTHVLKTTLSEYLNKGWYHNNETKNCPFCRATIQKNGGCNHMLCAMCHKPFLWEP